MKKIFNIALFFALLSIVIYSCKKDRDAALDLGYGYSPDKPGKYIIYNIDSIVKNSFTNKIDTFSFRIKEVIESVYYDNTGRPTLRLERYRKDSSKTQAYSQIPWILKDVWSANRTATVLEKTEENVKYVRLTFPVELFKTWNGNAFNTLGEWKYKYTEIDKTKTINGFAFDSTLTVIQIDQENLIDKKYYREIYAKNIGLVYKQIIDVHSDLINAQPIMMRVTSGIIRYEAKIIEYGG